MTYMPDLTVAAERIVRGNYNFTDDTGAQGAYTIFTVTGDVTVKSVLGICDVALTSGGAATIELGVAGDTAAIIAQTTATDLILNEVWRDATPTTTLEPMTAGTELGYIVSAGQDIIFTIGGADLTAGDIDFYALWRPLSSDSNVVAA
jgi:hypothetical protein